MVVNGIKRIDTDGGRYIVLADYGTEGLSVQKQFEEIEHALQYIADGGSCGSPLAIVELSCFDIQLPESV